MHVISVCHRRDVWIWKYSQHYIALNLPASRFTLIVDDCDYPLFFALTTSKSWIVVKSSTIITPSLKHQIKHSIRAIDKDLNFGWYWQQFLKIQAIANDNDDLCIIWDADTVPLRRLSLPRTLVGFYCKSNEYHMPYWKLNSMLLGNSFGKYPGFSFISQFMGINPNVVRTLISDISKHDINENWMLTISRLLGVLSTKHRMSEYELIGSYAYNTSSCNDFVPLEYPWIREGASFVSKSLVPNFKYLLGKKYSFAAFERRDIPQWTSAKDRLWRLFIYIASSVFRLRYFIKLSISNYSSGHLEKSE